MTDGINTPKEAPDEPDDIAQGEAWIANLKRTYDEYQDLALTGARHGQVEYDQLNKVALQALQNAVETANLVGKQAVAHRDIAIDNQWNPVTEGAGNTLTARAVSLDDASLKAIGAAVAAALANAIGTPAAKAA